ncbi:MAG: type II toxin-antitoxin system RelE/ParE family toxin, partial [Pirellulales bacterium]|nr:type II toxin-antitoxin system RelE/ParE family toxin [Pirellulales bacterium]
KYHPEAAAEILAAVRWYADKSSEVAVKFDYQLRQAEQQVVGQPEAWGPYLHGTRCYKLKGFPYGLIYLPRSEYLLGVAVAHLHREPGYWKQRFDAQ